MREVALRSAAGGVLVAIVVAAPLAFGTVHREARVVVFAACGVALALLVVDRWRRARPFHVTVPLVALGLATVVTALQLVPLPGPLLGLLAPATRELVGDGAHPLSLDPPSTWRELARVFAYAAFFAAATLYATETARRALLLKAAVGVALLISLIGVVQLLSGEQALLFVYLPERDFWQPHFFRGTFVNPNHLGALLCVTAPAALVMALRHDRHRVAWIVSALVLTLAAVLTGKRATLVAVVAGDCLAIGLGLYRLRSVRARQVAVLLLALGGLAGGLAVSGERMWAETEQWGVELDSPGSRVRLWSDALALSLAHPVTGIGRGAFEPAFTRFSGVAGQLRFAYAENEYLQTAIDWGWPVALGLVALAVWGAALAIGRAKEDTLAAAALAGIVALALHQAVDFAVELPGVGLPALALLAVVFTDGNQPRHGRRRFVTRPWFLLAPALLFAVVAVHAVIPGLEQDRAHLASLAADPGTPGATVLAEGERLRRRHPADYYLPMLVAERLLRDGDPRVLAWLNDALALNPRHPALHVMTAEVLAAAGRRSQALLEYRLAIEHRSSFAGYVWPRVRQRYGQVDALLAATPRFPGMLAGLAEWLQRGGHLADAEVVYGVASDLPGSAPSLLASWSALAIQRRDLAAARERVERLRRLDGRASITRQLGVRVELLAGDLPAAVALLDAERERSADVASVELLVCQALLTAGDLSAARARLDRVASWSLPVPLRAQIHDTRARLERAAGNEHQARWELEQRDKLQGQALPL